MRKMACVSMGMGWKYYRRPRQVLVLTARHETGTVGVGTNKVKKRWVVIGWKRMGGVKRKQRLVASPPALSYSVYRLRGASGEGNIRIVLLANLRVGRRGTSREIGNGDLPLCQLFVALSFVGKFGQSIRNRALDKARTEQGAWGEHNRLAS